MPKTFNLNKQHNKQNNKMKNQANNFDNTSKKSFKKGFRKGYNKGIHDLMETHINELYDAFDVTYKEGEKIGFDNGFENGFEKGFDDGFDSGFDDGFEKGCVEGFEYGSDKITAHIIKECKNVASKSHTNFKKRLAQSLKHILKMYNNEDLRSIITDLAIDMASSDDKFFDNLYNCNNKKSANIDEEYNYDYVVEINEEYSDDFESENSDSEYDNLNECSEEYNVEEIPCDQITDSVSTSSSCDMNDIEENKSCLMTSMLDKDSFSLKNFVKLRDFYKNEHEKLDFDLLNVENTRFDEMINLLLSSSKSTVKDELPKKYETVSPDLERLAYNASTQNKA